MNRTSYTGAPSGAGASDGSESTRQVPRAWARLDDVHIPRTPEQPVEALEVRDLATDELLAVRTAVLVEGRRLSEVAKAFGASVEGVTRACSCDTRFLCR
jgi:hypothetical protein